MEKNKPFNLFSEGSPKRRGLLFLALSLAWLAFCLILFYLERTNEQVILIDLGPFHLSGGVLLYSLGLITCIWVFVGLRFLWKKFASKPVRFLLVLGWLGLILSFLAISLLFLLECLIVSYFDFPSPDKTRHVVAKETSLLLLGEIGLYRRENPFFIHEIKGAVGAPDDGFTPIEHGDYWTRWEGEVFTLAFYRNYGDGSWQVIDVDFSSDREEVKTQVLYPRGGRTWLRQ